MVRGQLKEFEQRPTYVPSQNAVACRGPMQPTELEASCVVASREALGWFLLLLGAIAAGLGLWFWFGGFSLSRQTGSSRRPSPMPQAWPIARAFFTARPVGSVKASKPPSQAVWRNWNQ